ncbi:uncharacterized protein EDB91DRAFT_1009478, partial [Suillus paluster]|uniref:uncharacterized protein n=1 Tax=Suillus paluster TaxID=48578 RepID=UPI001B876F1B
VLIFYSKGGGKNGKHAWTDSASSITAVSYIAVQVYEHMIGPQFRSAQQDPTAL